MTSKTPDSFDWSRVRSAFLAGEHSRCRELLAGAPEPRAQLWLAQIENRETRFDSMLQRLLSISTTDEHLAAERDSWLAAAYANIGELALAHQLLDRALEVLAPPDQAYYRALYTRALAYSYAREYDGGLAAAQTMLGSPSALDRALAHLHRGWVSLHREGLRGQLDHLLAALDEYELAEELDQYTFMHMLVGLSSICRELGIPGVFERIQAALPRIRDSEATAQWMFLVQRYLGWAEALRGNELAALRRWRIAQQQATTDYWRVFCLVDRAYLADVLGRKDTARTALNAAHAYVERLDWAGTQNAESIILLTIAQLYAEERPVIAARYIAQFRSLSPGIRPAWNFSDNSQWRALALYPHGAALLRMGERDAGVRMLEEAHGIFSDLQFRWRAALAALGLYEASGERRWLERAREQAAPWPRSWIARAVQNAR